MLHRATRTGSALVWRSLLRMFSVPRHLSLLAFSFNGGTYSAENGNNSA